MVIDRLLKEGQLLKQDIESCQIFDFGVLLTIIFEKGAPTGRYREEEEQNTALIAFNEGFSNLPFPECIFVGSVQSIEYSRDQNQTFLDGRISRTFIFRLTQPDEQGDIKISPFVVDPGHHVHSFSKFDMKKSQKTSARYLRFQDLSVPLVNGNEELTEDTYALFHIFVSVALGRLISDGVEQEKNTPSEKLNRNRLAKGHPEMVSHTVVKLKPHRFPMGHSGPQGEDYTAKRYHFRRGHVRRFENGQKTWVRSCFVGDITQGRVKHLYDVSA